MLGALRIKSGVTRDGGGEEIDRGGPSWSQLGVSEATESVKQETDMI